jgi:hypothetical protein
MGIPAKAVEYEVPIAVRISREQAATIDTWAARLALNRAAVVRMLIAHARGEDGRLRVENPGPWCEEAISAQTAADEGTGHGVE